MNLIERVKSFNPQVNLIWRFYKDTTHHWRWQRLAFDGTVVEHSESAYSRYEACLDNASEYGYVSFPSLSTKAIGVASQARPASIRVTTGHPKLVAQIMTEGLEQREDVPIDDTFDGDQLLG